MTASLIVLGACVAPPSNVDAGSQNRFVERFIDLAVGRDGSSTDGTLIRWCAPIAYRVSGFLPAHRASVLTGQFRDLSALTGIAARPADPANYFVHIPLRRVEGDLVLDRLPYLSRRARRKLGRARCFFVLNVGGDGCIRRADVVLPRELSDGEFEHCATEELGQSMGLPNDAGPPEESIFAEGSTLLDRSEADTLFLRLLYHPDLRPGMDRATLARTVPDLLPGLKP